MGEIIFMSMPNQEADWSKLDREGLLRVLESVRNQIQELDEREPEDMDSEAYQEWGDAHEKLEDQVDELMEILDEREE